MLANVLRRRPWPSCSLSAAQRLSRCCSSSSSAAVASRGIDLVARAEALDVRLTAKERAFLLRKADVDGDGAISEHEFVSLVRGQQLPVLERRTLLELRDQAHVGSLGQ